MRGLVLGAVLAALVVGWADGAMASSGTKWNPYRDNEVTWATLDSLTAKVDSLLRASARDTSYQDTTALAAGDSVTIKFGAPQADFFEFLATQASRLRWYVLGKMHVFRVPAGTPWPHAESGMDSLRIINLGGTTSNTGTDATGKK